MKVLHVTLWCFDCNCEHKFKQSLQIQHGVAILSNLLCKSDRHLPHLASLPPGFRNMLISVFWPWAAEEPLRMLVTHRRASVGILTVNAEICSSKFNRNSTLKNKQKKQSITFKPTGLLIGVLCLNETSKVDSINFQSHLYSDVSFTITTCHFPATHHIDELCVTLASEWSDGVNHISGSHIRSLGLSTAAGCERPAAEDSLAGFPCIRQDHTFKTNDWIQFKPEWPVLHFQKIKARDFIKYPSKKKKGGVGERESASRGHFHVLISLPRQQN